MKNLKRLTLGVLAGATCLSAWGLPVEILSSKPDFGVLVQNDPDGTALLAFDAEENRSARCADRPGFERSAVLSREAV